MKKPTFKTLVILPLALGMLVSVSACLGETTEESPVPETSAPAEESTSAEAPEETEEPTTADDSAPAEDAVIVPAFTFTNTGEEEICELYLSPVGVEEWGPDQLGEATIPPSEEYVLQDIPAGEYDVRAVGCEGGEVTGTLNIQPQ